ncbi:tryptophan synthase subunit alpha [Orenia metallireducens]|uniref:Tryptophan synthase alpha chain n=1 Tax=Orenia metallireducens TaxID=1413210 RepID=A0A1C0A5A5_9FIRM|nr:tryptophan synthase subunit alpha [Orenia metallireducens]OCL25327.1 tryptophan synthase subunit alpha [Orenia metallireducens]
MSRIATTFASLRDKGQKAFIPFLMAGDPTLDLTKDLVLEAERNGADIIELGIPFSNPLADGPTIQRAGKRSLAHRTNLKNIFNLVKDIRNESQIPIVLMGYFNSIFNYGLDRLIKSCEEFGVDGLIIPDLPMGEDEELRNLSNGVDIISLVALNSSPKRIKELAENSQGFIYAVATLGTTGERGEVSKEVKEKVEEIKSLTSTPVAVGFGISEPEHVKEVASFADGVIVGSAIIKRLEENLVLLEDDKIELIKKVAQFISTLIGTLN